MNPDYKQISASDASKMLGVHKTSVTNWCKAGMINFIDVSEPGSARPRYVIPEDEIDKIKRAMKKHGKRTWVKYYKKTVPVKFPTQEEPVVENEIIEASNTPTEEEIKPSNKQTEADKITTTILYIREIKERLEDLEAEKNQLLNELETLRKEVMDYI